MLIPILNHQHSAVIKVAYSWWIFIPMRITSISTFSPGSNIGKLNSFKSLTLSTKHPLSRAILIEVVISGDYCLANLPGKNHQCLVHLITFKRSFSVVSGISMLKVLIFCSSVTTESPPLPLVRLRGSISPLHSSMRIKRQHNGPPQENRSAPHLKFFRQ